MAKISKHDEVLVRGTVVTVDEITGILRVAFKGAPYPTEVHPDAVERVEKYREPKEPRVKPKWDKPD